MKVINTIDEMRRWSYERRLENKKIGFVPTMGFLHEGHLSLIREARKYCDTVVVSIFVNPTQFAPNEDLERYPRDFERDQRLCRQERVDAVFYPPVEEIYLPGHITYIETEKISAMYEGKTRPTHFRGVTTIVAKLFNIVLPHLAVFGQKDAQQAFILRKMVTDLNFDIEMIVAPIIREKDGLAMSSRNKYLTEKQRAQANILYRSLRLAEEKLAGGNRDYNEIEKDMQALIDTCDEAETDYIAFIDTDTFLFPTAKTNTVRILIAVYFGSTRLIDNWAVSLD
jgi:pantoate--beta-alanine ligase